MTRIPTFYSAPAGGPRPRALAGGALVAAAVLAVVLVLLARGGRLRPGPAGSDTQRAGLFGVEAGGGAAPSGARVTMRAPRPGPSHGYMARYFRDVRVLGAIDSNHDLILSADEIARSAAALRALDRDRDGSLSPEECGFETDPGLDPGLQRRTRVWFMRVHPVLAAIDTDRDGTLSAVEIATAPAALGTLDWDHDGELSGDELLPDPVTRALALYMVRWDADGDGAISPAEAAAIPRPMREVVVGARRAGQSVVKESGLLNEIRRRAITDGDAGERQVEIAGEGQGAAK
jgi:hypothetical protein